MKRYRWLIVGGFVVILAAAALAVLAKAPAARRASERETEGWIILRGEYIPGPYEVEIVGDAVCVNGRSTRAPDPPPENGPPGDDKYAAQDKMFRDFGYLWQRWVQEMEYSAACKRALEYFEGNPLVEKATLYGGRGKGEGGSLSVRCKDFLTDIGLSLDPPDSEIPDPATRRREILEEDSKLLRYALTHEMLIIMESEGRQYSVPPPESRRIFGEIRRITEEFKDTDSRFAELKNVIPEWKMARAIAENFR